ncbi:SDR family NAD(P)-dependent oxidoreductase [Planococcus shixiaomingii]|uniref:SDR family NAD(P)-dependent oxidoreductase n=1 Tax=Planococcus shixiaomingii TaxID=3058393 RepID=UPI00260EB623|nr:SDR family NAD(P)-dependent oxidoreductase [Planococcus sp. N022]WKA54392.1 SDR family NAD(P)-dependent oxidoreductase [Planococcus sp. N022]
MPDKTNRQGLTVVITGTSSGIGKGTAQQLAEQGANVVLAARRTEVIEELADAYGPNVIAVTTDISKEEDISRLYETALSTFGGIDVWINNAGVGTYGSFTDTPLADLVRTVEINMLGTIYGTHYALRHFKEQKKGTLINIASFASQTPIPFGAVYTGTKAAVSGLSKGLYQEMNVDDFDDIHISVVDPWVTDTPWTEHAGNYSGHEILVGPADDPQKVIDAIIGLIDKPQEQVAIGIKGKGTAIAGNLMPGATGKSTGKALHEMLMDAPPAPSTSGSLHESRPEGTEVSGDLRERLERKKSAE